MNIKTILQSGEVSRYHAHAGVAGQYTGQHQWGVALILQHIYPAATKELLMAALLHDAAEYHTGDVPAPVKWGNPTIRRSLETMENSWNTEMGIATYMKLTKTERGLICWADAAEGMWYCIQQIKCGNKSAMRPFRKWKSRLMEMGCPTEAAKEFMLFLIAEERKWNERSEL